MKIRKNTKILKEQSGGIIYTPFIPSYSNTEVEAETNSSNSNVEKIGDIQKEILGVLKENGLPSDVDYFMNKANLFLKRAETTGNWSMSEFTQMQSLANRVAHNKALFDSAATHLTEKGNWNEVALNDKGQMYVLNKNGNIEQINPEEYYNNIDKYQALTNNDVLEYRSNANPFDSAVLNSMSGSIGLNDIVEYVKGIILDFGTHSISGYTNTELAKMEQSLMQLISGGPNGYYKFKKEAQIDESGAQQALYYLYNSLPTNMKQLLKAKTAAEGQNPNTDSKNLLMLMLANHVDDSMDISFDSTATKSAGIGADAENSKQTERTLAERYVDGNGLGEHKLIELRPWNSNASMLVIGQSAQTIMDKDLKNPLPTSTLDQVFTQGYGIGAITRKDSVSFGDQLIRPSDYNKVVYDSSTSLYRVMMPYRNENGKIVPDLQLIETASSLQKELQAQNITDPGYISELVNDYFNGKAIYNPTTKTIDFKDQMAFMTFGAILGSNNIDFNTNSNFIYHLPKEEGKQLIDIYNNTINYGNIYGVGNERIGDYSKTRKGKFYVGNIFIPIDNSLAGAFIFNNDTAPASRYRDMTAQAETNSYIRSIQQNTNPRTNF